MLYSRGQERQDAIGLELADTLDQMTIAVEAGLGFESAMARAGANGKGPLAEELVRTLQDIAVGQPRREAYLALAERTGVKDLARFIRAVVQADAYGVSIADVLRTQAQEMRLKRRQRAEEKAMQIPVKVIFPLILCILPTLFIVLLGPAVMDIVAAFSK
jgi:tight adherence protein C